MQNVSDSPPRRLLIADDHAMMLDGMRLIIQAEWPEAFCAFAKDYREVMGLLAASQEEAAFDTIVLDLRMPGMRGVESVSEISRRSRGANLVVCTALDDPGLIERLRDSGVSHVVRKAQGAEALLTVLRQSRVPAATPDQSLLREESQASGSSMLTARQREILRHLQSGKPNKVIAAEMGIGIETVKSHLQALYAAMGVANRSAAIVKSQGWML